MRAILRHEWMVLRRDRAAVLAALLFLGMTLFAVANGGRWLEQRKTSIQYERQQNAELYATLRADADAVAAGTKKGEGPRMSHRAVLDPAPLAALAVARGDLDPFMSRVGVYTGRHSLFSTWELSSPRTLLAGRFDLAFVTVFLFPLLIIALTYDVLSAEREQGTLAMIMAQPVGLRSLLGAKIVVRALVIVGTAVMISGLAALRVVDLSAGGAGTMFAAWLLATLLYGAFWFALALVVNAMGKRSATNAVVLITAWVTLAVIVPAALNLIVGMLLPLPSRLQHLQSVRAIDNETARNASRILDRFYHDHPELVPEKDRAYFTRTYFAQRVEQERQLLPGTLAFEQRLRDQQAAVDRLRFLSPAILVSESLARIAGNDRLRFQAYQDQLRQFTVVWRERFMRHLYLDTPLTPAEARTLPEFRFQDPTVAAGSTHLAGTIGGLALLSVLCCAAGFAALRRYTVAG